MTSLCRLLPYASRLALMIATTVLHFGGVGRRLKHLGLTSSEGLGIQASLSLVYELGGTLATHTIGGRRHPFRNDISLPDYP